MAYNIYTNSFDYQPNTKKRAEQLQKQKAERKDRIQEELIPTNSHQADADSKSAPN